MSGNCDNLTDMEMQWHYQLQGNKADSAFATEFYGPMQEKLAQVASPQTAILHAFWSALGIAPDEKERSRLASLHVLLPGTSYWSSYAILLMQVRIDSVRALQTRTTHKVAAWHLEGLRKTRVAKRHVESHLIPWRFLGFMLDKAFFALGLTSKFCTKLHSLGESVSVFLYSTLGKYRLDT